MVTYSMLLNKYSSYLLMSTSYAIAAKHVRLQFN